MQHSRRWLTRLLGASALTFVQARFQLGHAESVTYDYDSLGRIISVTYATGKSITYAYDAAGNRTQVVQTTNVPAPTGSLAASPTTIPLGASSSLTWASTNATSVVITPGIGAVSPIANGSISVSPTATTTYSARITGPAGFIDRTATVTVGPAPAPTGSLVASPTTVLPGVSSTLTWTSANATSVTINQGVGAVSPVAGGSVSITPPQTRTYTATITGLGGSITRTATVTVTLTASRSSATWTWRKIDSNPTVVTPLTVTATATGGAPPYVYAWQYVSGDTVAAATSPASATTAWDRSSTTPNVLHSSQWRCRITDSLGVIAYTPNVAVSFQQTSIE